MHRADEQYPVDVLCMERIAGVNAGNPRFLLKSKRKRKFFTETVINALGKIHETTNDKFGFIDGTGTEKRFDTWQEFYQTIAFDVYEKAKVFYKGGKLSRKIFELLEKGIENIDFIIGEKVEKACLLHGDLNIFNIMADKKTFAPTGIIDPFNSMWGDKEYDLFQLNALTGVRYHLFNTYIHKYGGTKRAALKCAFYALVNEILCHIKSGWSSKVLYFLIAKRIKKQYKIHGIR
jgi:fructosamine-3-kinase